MGMLITPGGSGNGEVSKEYVDNQTKILDDKITNVSSKLDVIYEDVEG